MAPYFAIVDGAVAVFPTLRFTLRGTFSIVNSIRRFDDGLEVVGFVIDAKLLLG